MYAGKNMTEHSPVIRTVTARKEREKAKKKKKSKRSNKQQYYK